MVDMNPIRIGILGGSGLYRMERLTDVREQRISTPFGDPSDALVPGRLDGVDVAFLARHDRGHGLLPSEVPYRANLYAMKSLGVQYLLSVSAVGSLHEDIAPLDMVLPDQFIDLTKRREGSFFGGGAVAHVALADPVCPGAARRAGRSGGRRRLRRDPLPWRRHLRLHRRPRVLYPRRVALVPQPGRRGDRHDQHARGAPGPRGRDRLCVAGTAGIRSRPAGAPRWHWPTCRPMHSAHRWCWPHAVRRIAQDWPPSAAHTALAAVLVTPVAAMIEAVQQRLQALIARRL